MSVRRTHLAWNDRLSLHVILFVTEGKRLRENTAVSGKSVPECFHLRQWGVRLLRNVGICNFQFFEPASYFQRVINTEIHHQYKNAIFRLICKIGKMNYELHHVCLAVHLSVRPCETTQLPLDGFSLKLNYQISWKSFENLSEIIEFH